MDDCNHLCVAMSGTLVQVQIPLWTIVTVFRNALLYSGELVQIPLWTIVTAITTVIPYVLPCSDSSMDDCNHCCHIKKLTNTSVQIPLWTIVTTPRYP